MMTGVSRDSLEAAGSLLMMGAAAGIALLSVLAFLLMPLLMWGLSLQERAGWWAIFWVAGAGLLIFFNITRAVEVVREPAFFDLLKMVVGSSIVIATCPLWY